MKTSVRQNRFPSPRTLVQIIASRWHHGDVVPVLILYSLLALVFGWELLVPGRSLFQWDTLLYNWPVLLETRAQILAGRWPFWASSFCCGTPLLENINAGVLYPLRLICWLLPLNAGYRLFILAHLWLSFVAMHLLVTKGFRLSHLAGLVAALAYGAGGYARGMWDTHNFMPLPWIPLGFAALLGARNSRWPLAAAGTALCWAMLLLNGDFQAACLWLPAAVLLCLLSSDRFRLLRTLALASVIAILLAAPQWLPSVMASSASYRSGGLSFSDATERSFHPVRLLELVMPFAFGNRAQWFGLSFAGDKPIKLLPWISSFHVGVFALLPAALAIRKRRQPVVLWLLAVLLVSLLLSMGRFMPGFAWWQKVPAISSFRYPEKYLLWSSFSLAALSAFGVSSLTALWNRASLSAPRRGILATWGAFVIIGSLMAVYAVRSLNGSVVGVSEWLDSRLMFGIGFVLITLVLGWVRKPVRASVVLPVLCLMDLVVPWSLEQTTTSRFDPMEPPAVAQAILDSGPSTGRFLRDRAVTAVPLPSYFEALSAPEKKAVFYRESLTFNSPRLWGIRSADGFSPVESGAMRALRTSLAAPADEKATDIHDLVAFCRSAAVEWLMTTSDRAKQLAQIGLNCETARTWGAKGEVVLLRLRNVAEAEVLNMGQVAPRLLGAPHVQDLWRPRPGFLRITLIPGDTCELLVKETYSRGWQATDQSGRPLDIVPVKQAFIGIHVPARTNEVRLTYEPVGWLAGVLLGLAGMAFLVLVLAFSVDAGFWQRFVLSPSAAIAVGCILFFLVGILARDHWGCVFDEGFHVARGVAHLETGDSRLSFFHPPLQNLLGGYFADLAFGDRITIPREAGWNRADLFLFSREFAIANRDIFIELVRASRWGSVLLGLLLCGFGIHWASRCGGVAAGWLAALGLALNANLLAHGNLNTTDMGVAAFALIGTYMTWLYVRNDAKRMLFWAAVCFVLAAVSKFSGIVWLLAFTFGSVPLLAARKRNASILWFVPLSVLLLIVVVLASYGWQPALIRAEPNHWLTGKVLPAGRYIEGLFRQGGHALRGQRSFFAGLHFLKGPWWYMPAVIALKTPLPWLVAMVASAGYFAFSRRRLEDWIPWVPAVVFGFLLCTTNQLAIGVRHALPLIALGVVVAAIGTSRVPDYITRQVGLLALVLASLLSAMFSYPNYIKYFAFWAGGVDKGYRWVVDSNYDWGQDIDTLEGQWGAIVNANGGRVPDLVYFGFVDPRIICRMPVGPRSWCGFMDHTAVIERGTRALDEWHRSLEGHDRVVVASISSLKLMPDDVGLGKLSDDHLVGRIGNSFFVYDLSGTNGVPALEGK